MNSKQFLRIGITLLVVAAALWVGTRLWDAYETEPWTRDGRVRADVVQVAPDVSGLVTQVLVHDNQQVTAGTPLFLVDRPRFELAVREARAALAAQQAQLAQARREVARNATLDDLVPAEQREQAAARVSTLAAGVAQARVALDKARLDLSRTAVVARVDGTISNLSLRPGDYASAGKPVFAIIDRRSIHIVGYFEETKLPRIHVGDPVEAVMMGTDTPIRGHVESIAGGIEDRDRTEGATLLPNVNPTFSWVRLAQRIPVRIAIDRVPAGVPLVSGRTTTVQVLPAVAATSPARNAAHPAASRERRGA